MTVRSLAGTVVGLLAASVTAPLAAQSGSIAVDSLTLRFGDAVRITVWRKPELSGEFGVAGDGSLVHPLYRAVVVTGLPLSTVEARVRTFLQQYEVSPQFVIEPLVHVTVSGEAAKPNLLLLTPQTTIADALALAGGPNDRGRRDRVQLYRGATSLLVDLTRPRVGLAQAGVRSGDQIFVERRSTTFRDVVVPFIGIAGSLAAIITVVRYRR